jgi:hypothetical protein
LWLDEPCVSTYFFLDFFAVSLDYWESLGVEMLKGDTADEFDESAGRGLHVGSCDDELVKSGVIVKDVVMCLVMNADR